MLWGPRPQAPDALGFNPSSHLVIGYHWLALLNSESGLQKSQKIKRTILLNEKMLKNRKIVFAYVSEHLHIFWDTIFLAIFEGGWGFCMLLTWTGLVKS